MELLLNIVWLVVASAAVASWARSRSRATADPGAWRAELFALGCALVLLFPIISLSDDLQAEPAAVEASRSGQPTVQSGADRASVASGKICVVPVGAIPVSSADACNRFLYRLDDRAPAARLPRCARCSALRAPPHAQA